jgi:acyl-CoA thioesterase-1
MLKRFLLLSVLLWGGLAALPAVAAPVILVWGDSLGASYGVPSGQGWVVLLDQRLKAQGYDYTVVNGSVSGETTAGGVARLPRALAEHKPTIVVIELGSNDALRGTAIQVMRDNLTRMITLCKREGAKVLLLGMLMPPNYGPEYTREFKDSYTDLAARYRVGLLPFFLQGVADRRELMQADNEHPTAEAQPLLLDNVWPELKPLLKKN